MSKKSGGILPFRFQDNHLEVLLVHPGGPLWAGKDDGAWSISKGLFEENESPLDAARREFKEETGFEVDGVFIELGRIKQPRGKIVFAWAVEKNLDERRIVSNKFMLEWPRRSGIMREFPEIDRADWFEIESARKKILKGQQGFIDRLLHALDHPNVHHPEIDQDEFISQERS
ncbi:NUDIX domain-containing protein [Methanothrix soehngenii]|jgi:predicted NUDIX family NTP pyrophosphohydrolase|uniref:NUDIX domain-containing protein n=1 Tax=Methanothrix soehngenii TaxID=2223 RepID=UPI003142E0A2